MDKIITAIMNRLSEQVPALAWIDVDLGQLSFDAPPVDYPCALIDVANVEYSGAGRNVQMAITTVNINLAFTVLSPSDHTAPEVLREQAMEHYRTISEVYQALQGYGTVDFAPLNRTTLTRQKNTYPRHFTMTFRTQAMDNSGAI